MAMPTSDMASGPDRVYSDHPYPERNPEDERARLVETDLSQLRLISSVFWGGRRPLGKGFRVLDAGCGTGDACIHLAEQLRGSGAEVVGLDFSEKALGVASERARIRGLDGLTFVRRSILDIGPDLGDFDYIVCSGVLPNLEDPEGGLKALSARLKDDGGMGISVYARYGRLPIPIMQKLVRIIGKGKGMDAARIEEVRASLPDFNWVKLLGSYPELRYDAMLPPSGTGSFDVPGLRSFLAGAGLRLLRFRDRVLYDPGFYLGGREGWATGLSGSEKEELAELLNSRIMNHSFFAVKASNKAEPPDPYDGASVPIFIGQKPRIGDIPEGMYAELTVQGMMYRRPLRIDRRHKAVLDRIDGKATVRQILDSVSSSFAISDDEAMALWRHIYETSKSSDMIVIYRKS